MYIDDINEPSDLKKLNIKELEILKDEIREILLYKISNNSGHFGSNFGAVELEIALHYVFNSPIDKIVYDVSHQSYTHKILTGRKNAFIDSNHFNDISGYTSPKESSHDIFTVGHTSTSLSLASGLAIGRDLNNKKENIIAFIGDGSLSGGQALEALNFIASEIHSNLIIVLNDNDQSIAENHGGLYKNLKNLRESKGLSEFNIFKNFGLDYIYIENGHDLTSLISVFSKVKDIDHPIVVHVKTIKGYGYTKAIKEKEKWHFARPFDIETGKEKNLSNNDSYESLTASFLLNKIKQDKRVVVVTAAMPNCIGFNKEIRDEASNQYIDVGIAEEHGVSMCAAIAKNKGKPIFATNASFLQRSYDQLSQDLCIDSNPATILLNKASIYKMSDITHLGIYTISAFNNIPNLVILAPTSKKEYFAMLDYSIEQDKYPMMILMPCNGVIDDTREVEYDYSNIDTFKVEEKGSKVAIIALGDFYQLGEELVNILKTKQIYPTLINPRYASGLDYKLLDSLKDNHDLVITLEDSILFGGFGANISSYLVNQNIKVLNYGLEKKSYDHYKLNDVLKENELDANVIAKTIENYLLNK